MAQQLSSITVIVGTRWWFGPILKLLLVVHRITGWAPSEGAIRELARRSVRTWCDDVPHR